MVLKNTEGGDTHQQDQSDGSDDGMRGDIPSAAEGNHGQKINQNAVIEQGVSDQPVRDEQKPSQRDQHGPVNNAVDLVPLSANIPRQHADADQDVGDDDQDSEQYGEKTGMEKNIT